MEITLRKVAPIVAAASTLACRASDLVFSSDPLISGVRGAISTAAIGIELFGLKSMNKAFTQENASSGVLKILIMTALPIITGILSAEIPAISYELMGIALLGGLSEATSR